METVKKFIEQYGLIRHQLESYHDFVYFGIDNVIRDEPNVYCSQDFEIKFDNVRFEKPYILTDKTKKPLFPSEARLKSLTYEFTVKIDVVKIFKGGEERETMNLCRLPAMVRSKMCNLYGLSESDRVGLGEVLNDCGGYFIINGKERVITGQTKRAYNKFICTKNLNDELVCEMRSSCEETSKSSSIIMKYNKRGFIDLTIDKVSISISKVFKDLGVLEILDILVGSDNLFLEEIVYIIKINVDNEDNSPSVAPQLFHHMGYSTNLAKGILLAKMVRNLALTECGVLAPEEKNNLAYKRVDMVGPLCKDLFKMLWKQFIKSISKRLNLDKKIGPIIPMIKKKKQNIRINFAYCFSTGNWGIKKNSYKKLGVSEFAQNKVSALTNVALLRKFNIPTGKKDKNVVIRQMHPSSIFFACPFETPEGASVGTRLTLSILASVSLQMPIILLRQILEYNKLYIKISDDIQLTDDDFVILLNGIVVGISKTPQILLNKIEYMRLNNEIRYDVSVSQNDSMKTIEVWCDGSRFIRPLFNAKKMHLFKDTMSFSELENNGIIVYRDPCELERAFVSMDNTTERNPDYIEIHPACIMGIVASQIVFSNHTQSPRVCYMSNMIKQAIGILPCLSKVTDATHYSLNYVQKPINTTTIATIIGSNDQPNGVNAIVAIMCYTGFNQEDSIILNKGSIDRGLFTAYVRRTISTDVKIYSGIEEEIGVPSEKRLNKNYSKLDSSTGLVKVGSQVKKGDVIIGKILKIKTEAGCKIEDISICVKANEEGTVESVVFVNQVVKVTILQTKIPEVGDKFCSGMAQKGTCGLIMSQEDMPFVASTGMSPDIIINPHCMPSRMTINQLMSSICAKARCISGKEKFSLGDPFSGPSIVEEAQKEIIKHGYDHSGNELMINGMTGEYIKATIFIGPVYYHRLTHLVSNKMFSYTNTNIKNKLTRQPLNGRSNDGGLRIGEMEKDCLMRNGVVKFMHERMMDLSDKYTIMLCNICKHYSHVIKNNDNCYFCNKCKTLDVEAVSIPYAAKLLCQELESIGLNVEMRT